MCHANGLEYRNLFANALVGIEDGVQRLVFCGYNLPNLKSIFLQRTTRLVVDQVKGTRRRTDLEDVFRWSLKGLMH